MSRPALYIAMLIFLMGGPLLPGALLAQEEDSGIPIENAQPSPAESITFEGTEDSSLFVGFYRLNAGDTIHVEIITDLIRGFDPMIDDEGFIAMPIIGRVQVADLTVTEARQALQDLVDRYYVKAWVTCRVVQIARVKFYVYGDISQPGFYTASGATTFFDFLQRFGLAGREDHRRIVHVRGQRSTALPEPMDLIGEPREPSSALIDRSLELWESGQADRIEPRVTITDPLDFTMQGEIEQRNFYLEYGDVIYVPDPGVLVSIEGFRRQGQYEVLPGETWSDLIRLAGQPGLTRDDANIVLERHDLDGNLVQLYYNLNRLSDEQLATISLQDQDRLIAVSYDTNVYVIGEVNEAGAFPYTAGLNAFDYLAMAAGPTPQAHLRFAVIVRPPEGVSASLEDSSLYPVDLGETLISGSAPSPVTMKPGDILFIPNFGTEVSISTVLNGLSVLVNAVRLF